MTYIEGGSVLVVVSEYGEFGALFTLCRQVESNLDLHPIFVFASGYGLVQEHGQLVELEGWSWTQLGTGLASLKRQGEVNSHGGYFRVFSADALMNRKHSDATLPLGTNYQLLRTVFSILRLPTLVVNVLFKRRFGVGHKGESLLLLLRSIKHAKRLISVVRPRLILSGQDYALSATSLLSIVGEREGIRTAVVPFNMPPTTRELIESFAYFEHNKIATRTELWLARRLNPKWLNVRRGQVYSRVNVYMALLADKLGLTPAEPWLPNSGRGVVFVPSQWAYDYYLQAGIPRSHLRLTGAVWSDALVHGASSVPERKRRLRAAIRGGRKQRLPGASGGQRREAMLVVISWPPNQYPRKALGCASYHDLCQQFMQVIRGIRQSGLADVVVSLHPTLTDPRLLSDMQRAGVYVLRDSLIGCVDCADVFVSTVSSTSFWALQCGIPTINFDGYLYGYTEFDEAGAVTVRTPAELFTTCMALVEDPQHFEKSRARVLERSRMFTEPSGANLRRVLSGLQELVATRPPAVSQGEDATVENSMGVAPSSQRRERHAV